MKATNFRLAILLVLALALFSGSGCTAKAKAERHLKRADEFYSKAEWEKAKLEYLNAMRRGLRDAQSLSRLGDCFIKDGDINSAYKCLIEARNLQPTNIVARQTVASLLLAVGQAKKAREEAEAILKISPSDQHGLVTLAEASTTQEEISSAKQRIEALRATAPNNASISFALGILDKKSGDLPAARTALEKAISLDPKQANFHLALADLAAAQGDTKTADASYKSAIALAPIKSWDRLRYAEYLQRSQRADEAIKFLEETVAQAPDFTRALNVLTDMLLTKRKLEEAEKYNAKALANLPNNRDGIINRSRLKLARQDIPGAVADLEELSKTMPRDPAVHYQLAMAYLANSNPAKALASADTAVTLDPKNVQAVLLRSELQLQKGDTAAAIPELKRVTREFPQVAEGYFLLASAYRQRGAFADALPIYTQLAKSMPRDARPYYFMGITYRQLNKPAEAREAFENALKISPDFVLAVDELVNLDITEKRLDSAMARVQPYLERFPKKPTPYLLQAKVLNAQGKTEEAIQVLQKSIELDPSFQSSQRALVELYVATGKSDEAVARLSALVKKNPKDAASYFQLALLQERAKDYKGARASYETLLPLAPNSPVALNNLANLLAEQFGETDAGYPYAVKARELAPGDPAIADTYGWALWKKGEYSRALAALQQAAEKLSTSAEVQYHLGMAYYMNGLESAAVSALDSAVQSKSDFIGKERARSALTILKVDPSKPSPETLELVNKAIKESPADFIAQLRLAQIHDYKKEFAPADQAYQAALKLNPRSTNVLARLAELNCFSLNQPQRALAFAKDAWSISQDGSLAATLGPIGYMAGDFKWSSAVLAEARRAKPNDGRVAFYSALANYALGDLAQAKNLFQESARSSQSQVALAGHGASLIAYQLAPTNSSAAASVVSAALKLDQQFPPALIVGGLIAEKKGDYTQARALYEQVLKSYGMHTTAQRQLGILMAEKLTDDQLASQLLTAAKAELPGDPQITKALGKLAYRRTDYKEAERLLKDSSIKLADDADLLYYLGMSQYQLNEKEATNSLSRYLKLDGNSTLSASAKKALESMK